jgi:hypothetical protein
VQVDQQCRAEFRQRRGDVDGGRCRPDAALGADEHEDIARDRRDALRKQAADRGFKFTVRHVGDALGHAGTHRLEHQRGIQRRRHDQQPRIGILTFHCRECAGDLRLLAKIQNQNVGWRAGGMSERLQFVAGDARCLHALGPKPILEVVPLRGDNGDVRCHATDLLPIRR